MNNNREQIISRVQKELIGPGTDLFECSDKLNFSDEVIADKPLLRYFSGILYPKQTMVEDYDEDDDQNEESPLDIVDESDDDQIEKREMDSPMESKDDDKEMQYSASTFFPSL